MLTAHVCKPKDPCLNSQNSLAETHRAPQDSSCATRTQAHVTLHKLSRALSQGTCTICEASNWAGSQKIKQIYNTIDSRAILRVEVATLYPLQRLESAAAITSMLYVHRHPWSREASFLSGAIAVLAPCSPRSCLLSWTVNPKGRRENGLVARLRLFVSSACVRATPLLLCCGCL